MTKKSVNLDFYLNVKTNKTSTKVVNFKKEEYDVYIGRPSIWGNPFSSKDNTLAEYKVSCKSEAIQRYEEYIESNEFLKSKLSTLKNKRLGCWCKPKPCHGDVLLKMIEKYCV